jgi:hypothetical protein
MDAYPTELWARQVRSRGGAPVRDGGDQGDQLVLPVAVPVGDLVLDDAECQERPP